jgi:hypothetical protein
MGEDAYENYNDFIKYNENVGYYIPICNIYFYKVFLNFYYLKEENLNY